MSHRNSFSATVECPHCQVVSAMTFDADIGELDYSLFEIGDLVIKTVPLVAKRGRHRQPIGPEGDVDYLRPFWGTGLATCPACAHDVLARIDIIDRRYAGARPTLDPLEQGPGGWLVLPWGYID